MKQLSRDLVRSGGLPNFVAAPPSALLNAPIRVLQFGTGRFLRAFTDWMLQRASAEGVYHGRAALVQSTRSGTVPQLRRQDNLFTVAIAGPASEEHPYTFEVVGSVGSAFEAESQWGEILKLAELPDVDVVVSNTTEVGIALSPNDVLESSPPPSFPGKLTAWLWHRFRALGNADESRVLVLPCELIDNNGDVLRACVEELAHRWQLPLSFVQWLRGRVTFCNTLVDRIVTGFPADDELVVIETMLGYKDELLNVCEPYHLWAVQAGPDAAERFPLHRADLNVIYTSDVTPYRDKKVRLLNGTHSLTAPVAALAGCVFVRDAMKHPLVSAWMRKMLMSELAVSLAYPKDEVEQYAESVLERFGNPNLRHRYEHILTNTLVKLRIRVVPSVISYAAKNGRGPDMVAFGFASLIAAVSSGERRDDAVVFQTPSGPVSMRDPEAAHLREALRPEVRTEDAHGLAGRLLSDRQLWGADLSAVPGFARAVGDALADILALGVEGALEKLLRRFPAA